MAGMANPREYTEREVQLIERAVTLLRRVRDDLVDAGALRAAEAARESLRSAEGALRHIRGVVDRTRGGRSAPGS